ncbi:MAG: DMT family transporter [Eubacteriales bacterium]|nr:DMT family transporter [Eubacteriales bacterium]MDD3883070.1 DMT family transporter [Eubacteriales bacterium]MDD4513621.1 DMT family transporter [Eubacteriales bacterium]
MYYFLSLLTGFLIAIMVVINGRLAEVCGSMGSTVTVHFVGLALLSAVCLFGKKKFKLTKKPIWMFLGGVMGVLTTLFNNLSFGRISMTSIMALGLFGQAVTSLLIDSFGLMGMKKHPIRVSSLCGIAFSAIGIIIMLDDSIGSALVAVMVSIFAGVTVVLSRTVNSRLSRQTGEIQSALVNYAVGLITAIIASAFFAGNELSLIFTNISPDWWVYIGGAMGAAIVLLYNIVVPRVSSFQLSLLTFVAQVFTGIVIDIVLGSEYSTKTFIGGIVVAAGVAAYMVIERIDKKKA